MLTDRRKDVMPGRRFIFASTAVLLLAAAAFAAPGEVALDKPSNFGNASIQLPKGWLVIEAGSDRFKAKAPQADKDSGGGGGAGGGLAREGAEFSANVSIKVTAVSGEIDMAAQQKNLEEAVSNYRRVEEARSITVGGAKGITFGGTFVLMAGKVPVRTRLYLVTIGGKFYVIAFSTLASRWADYEPQIEASVKTFAVK
jgi:hypothetical protein